MTVIATMECPLAFMREDQSHASALALLDHIAKMLSELVLQSRRHDDPRLANVATQALIDLRDHPYFTEERA